MIQDETKASAADTSAQPDNQTGASKHIFDKDVIKTFPEIQADLATPAPNEGKKGQGA